MQAHVDFEHLDEEHIAEFLANLPKGALKWCNRCHRNHRSRVGCNLVPAERTAKSGNIVTRLVHPTEIEIETEVETEIA